MVPIKPLLDCVFDAGVTLLGKTRANHIVAVLVPLVMMVAVLMPAPVQAQDFACPANAPAKDPQVSNILLPTLTQEVNAAWSGAAAQGIDPLKFNTGDQTSACPSDGGSACFFSTGLTNCEHATSNFTISALEGLSELTFSAIHVQDPPGFNLKDVTAHSRGGPDAGKITDGVFAPEGTTFNNPSYAVVLIPGPRVGAAVTIDLGSVMTICGSSSCGPTVQADRHPFQFDYSQDGVNWVPYSQVPAVSGSGLRTRKPSQIAPTNPPIPSFTARYVRLYGVPADDDNYSISEVTLKNTSGQIISINKFAMGSRPYQIVDGTVAPEGADFDDTTYAVVLRGDGVANALVIDLGAPVNLCGNGFDCLSGPMVQADRHPFQFDYSLDGVNWVSYSQVPEVSGSGLHTRGLRPIKSGQQNPNFTARYVRLYGLPADDDNYSISEVKLWDIGSRPVPTGALTYGPESVATDGETAPEGADFDDPRYANILSPCTTVSTSICPQKQSPASSRTGLTAGLLIDLSATFPISQLTIQADRHEFQIDYSTDLTSWQPLWTVPAVSSDGLRTRPTQSFPNLPQARYLLVYGTAGNDSNYSVSSVDVLTAVAKTPCAYGSGANAGQAFSCTYDGPIGAQIQVPATGLPIMFTVDEAHAHLRCTNGTTSANTPTKVLAPAGTTCSAVLRVDHPSSGSFCSGSCGSGSSVLTLAALDNDPTDTVFEVTDLVCSPSVDSTGTTALNQVVAAAASSTVASLFNGLVVTPIPQLGGPMVPSGICKASSEEPPTNAELRGAANLGKAREDGHVRLRGTFTVQGSPALDTLAFDLRTLLHESGGIEELARNKLGRPISPLSLLPQPGSRADKAIYATAPGVSPSIRAKVTKSKGKSNGAAGLIEFSISVNGVTLAVPTCSESPSPSVQLATNFSLSDSSGKRIEVNALQDWQCRRNRLVRTN